MEYINILEKPEQIRLALKNFGDLNNLANCTVVRTFSKDESKIKTLKEFAWIIYYYFLPHRALEETKVFQVNPSNEMVIEIWNVFSRLYPMRTFLKTSL